MTRETFYSCDWCYEANDDAKSDEALRDDFGWLTVRVKGHPNRHLCEECREQENRVEAVREIAREGGE